jgi:hypothetical protein
MMPASSIDHHHNAFTGGYVDHVIRVVNCSLSLMQLWESMGAVVDYTKEELVFVALNHDLGKIGTEEAEQYIPNGSDWHRKNLGKLYEYNAVNPFMTVPDRSLFLLQGRGIKLSMNEFFGIKLHDGLYEDSNKSYFISHTQASKLRSNLPIIMHHADHMAARIEYEKWAEQSTTKRAIKAEPATSSSISQTEKDSLMSVFNDLFK